MRRATGLFLFGLLIVVGSIANAYDPETHRQIGEQTAEEVKIKIGSALYLEDKLAMDVRGRDMVSGLPKTITERARELRRDSSRAEKICWNLIRDHRINGAKFRRQHPIDPYFADFACVSRKVIIEIDGEQHAYQVAADARRTAVMEQLGWRVVRF